MLVNGAEPPRSTGRKLLDYLLNDSIPAEMVKSAWSGVTLPGDVLVGNVDPMSAEGLERTMGLAGLAAMGNIPAGRMAQAAENVASRTARMYDPPAKAPRPFEADYPRGAVADEAGNLQFDIEGRPLTAEYIAGRNVVGQGEKALSPAELDAIATASTRDGASAVAPRLLRGDAGRTQFHKVTGEPLSIQIANDLSLDQANKVLGHEVGHVIDKLADEIPVDGLNRELRTIYNDLNNPQGYGKPFGPEQNRYKGDVVNRELVTEAIRAYQADPNYIKTVAPKTAARIREYVNNNPQLKHIIQFNSVVGGGAAALGLLEDDEFREAWQKGFGS
ncbi:MAG: hypothetical protein QHC90_25310 [Shinella sp.]|nr:hypothetical protein [Shinella sp.]